MSPRLRFAFRVALVAAAIATVVASAFSFRASDWPIYLVFVLLRLTVMSLSVEVLPGLLLPMPEMAVTIGFLYVGGLPIIILCNLSPPTLAQLLYWVLPGRLPARMPTIYSGPGGHGPRERLVPRSAVAADWAMYAIGLGVRWAVASVVAGGAPPWSSALAILAGEAAGYAVWSVVSLAPILSFSDVLRAPTGLWARALRQDLGLIMIPTLTPFIFLIAYGYRAVGVLGATAWSLAALGVHFLLKRLTERRIVVERQNDQLAALNRELEHRERLSAIGKMSSVVSHQMLQQLGIIGLHADLIRHAEADGDAAHALAQARSSAREIEDALADVNRVLTDLLVFSRDLRLNIAEHDLATLARECAEECGRVADARAVTIDLECRAAPPVVLDKLKMRQAIVNVVRNAIEAAPPGSVVTIASGPASDGVEIAVRDRGGGIAPGDADRVFAPFYTTKDGGTGLGLAIAREFTEAHGGRIAVDRTASPGTTVRIALPLRPQDAGGLATAAAGVAS
ncbi:MAG TPA: HAMP domain-containing sensor histidine kinase [Candidatus Binatia bacterium]|nr:HAMP domain-containing sensor histidine kinase [Candidatus Binatia bacterium]